MTAWSIATYIDRLAEAGKAILDIPMYINVWLGEGGWKLPGETYPSGGAVGRVLDIYKWCTPHVDLIAPDIYVADSRGYEAICALYARADNPLFVPESGPGGANAWNMFRALADYNAIGYAFFAVEHIIGQMAGSCPSFSRWSIAFAAFRPPFRSCCATRARAGFTRSSRRRTWARNASSWKAGWGWPCSATGA